MQGYPSGTRCLFAFFIFAYRLSAVDQKIKEESFASKQGFKICSKIIPFLLGVLPSF
jgi:hypothetical protein